MPDTNRLRIGDRIRILRVPEADLRQREREIEEGTEMAGWTADTIERIIESQPVVTISRIDEYGSVWYDDVLIMDDSEAHEHSLIVNADDTWEYID